MVVGEGRRAGAILGIAAGGLLAGHWLTYAVDIPHAAARADALANTGHGYLGIVTQIAALVAAISLATVFLGRLTRPGGQASSRAIATRLALVQIGTFIAMEMLERVGSSAGFHDLFSILPLGVVIQAVVALIGATVLKSLLAAADAIVSAATTLRTSHRGSTLVISPETRPVLESWWSSSTSRGPPIPVGHTS